MRILLADDHPVVRTGLREILEDAFPGAAFGETGSAEGALQLASDEPFDVALLDISLPGRSGLDILRDLRHLAPNMPVLYVSIHAEDQYALRALKAGAAGYLNKQVAPEQLVEAVRKVRAGGRYVSPSTAESLAVAYGARRKVVRHEQLSDREFEVLRCIARGQTPSEIARQLGLSVKTISTYRGRILDKMGLETTAQLMRYALDHQIV